MLAGSACAAKSEALEVSSTASVSRRLIKDFAARAASLIAAQWPEDWTLRTGVEESSELILNLFPRDDGVAVDLYVELSGPSAAGKVIAQLLSVARFLSDGGCPIGPVGAIPVGNFRPAG